MRCITNFNATFADVEQRSLTQKNTIDVNDRKENNRARSIVIFQVRTTCTTTRPETFVHKDPHVPNWPLWSSNLTTTNNWILATNSTWTPSDDHNPQKIAGLPSHQLVRSHQIYSRLEKAKHKRWYECTLVFHNEPKHVKYCWIKRTYTAST